MKFEKLGNIAIIKTGKYDVNHSTPDGDYVFYTCAYGQFKSPTYSFEGPAIILPGNGANVGEVFYYDGKFEAYQRTYVVQSFKADSNYIFSYFKSFWKNSLRNKQFGSATNYIRLNNLTDFLIPLPSLPDQLHIANLLSKAENLISQRKESISLLDEFLKSTFLEMFGDPVNNRKNWEKKKLKDLAQEFKYGTNIISSNVKTENAIPILRIPNIVDGEVNYEGLKYSELEDSEKKKVLLSKGDLLFVRTNGNPNYIARCAVFNDEIECGYASYLIRVKLKPNSGTNSLFIKYIVSLPSFRKSIVSKAKTTAGNYNINTDGLKDLNFIIPPIELQTQFASIVTKTETLKEQYKNSLQELENLYGSLSQRAFKGELNLKALSKAE